MGVIIILIAFVALALAAPRWGITTTDDVDSAEWERRRYWRGFH